MTPLTFHASGGTICFDRHRAIAAHQVQPLLNLLAGEALAAASVGASDHARQALELHAQLAIAAHDAGRWTRASRPVQHTKGA